MVTPRYKITNVSLIVQAPGRSKVGGTVYYLYLEPYWTPSEAMASLSFWPHTIQFYKENEKII